MIILWLPIFLWMIVLTIKYLWHFYKTKNKQFLYKFSVLWLTPICFISLLMLFAWFNGLTHVDKQRIVGSYEVDTKFYPGKNANWQKEHFRFEITEDNKFYLFVRLADKSENVYQGYVKWANETPEKWSITMDNPYHIIDKHPVLYRSKFDYYYVFRTQKFGNMFFSKVD
ncbi:MAG: hypothetical protein HRT54_21685 [Colwellia sp.]|nr:hypothetical protein [Colwellia sp.]